MSHENCRITALVYTDSVLADRALRTVARRLEAAGQRLAGVVRRDTPRADRVGCDMTMEALATGAAIGISRNRGSHARGCRLDLGEFARTMHLASAALEDAPDLLILNKFGKTEAEGGGFRALIAEAVEHGVPALVAVPCRNLDQLRAFAGDMAREVHLGVQGQDGGALLDGIGVALQRCSVGLGAEG